MRRSKAVLAVAIILGLVSSLLVFNVVNKANQQRTANLVSVLVAAQDIPARTPITEQMVKAVQVPVETKHPAALTKIDEVTGKVSRVAITAGEQVLVTKFAAQREDQGLAFTVPSSHRGVSVKVTEVIGSGGLIVPGDHVDVIAVFDKQTMGKDLAEIILQNVEVLAVAQRVSGEPDQAQAASPTNAASQMVKNANGTASAAEMQPKSNANPQPEAKSVTLSVTPEEAQRLVLADEMGKIRLALRPYQEGSTSDLPEATLAALRSPVQVGKAQITAVSITPANLKAGDTMKVKITVKNTSDEPIRSSGPKPGYTYVQGQTFFSQGFASQDGTFRVGVNLDGQTAINYPYRWGLGKDLAPGASTVITGQVKLTYDMKATNFWAGLIQEPAAIVQDNVGTTLVTVMPVDKAVVSVDVANVRSGPNISASVLGKVEYGKTLQLLGQEGDWYRVKLEDGREGFVAAGWIVTAGAQVGAPTSLAPQAPR